MKSPPWSFVGLSTEQGQARPGLIDSPFIALKFLDERFKFNQKINIEDRKVKTRIPDDGTLGFINWSFYHDAHRAIRDLLLRGNRVVNWGGDHSVGMATVSAFSNIYTDGYILWIDAHADLNTAESSLTGNFHGMPLSILLGVGNIPSDEVRPYWSILDPKKLIYFGLRDVDPFEREVIDSLGITSYFSSEINFSSLDFILSEILEQIGTNPLHISFDIDSIDPEFAPSTGVPARDGLSDLLINTLAKHLGRLTQLKSVDVVEINPRLGSFIEVIKTYSIAYHFLDQILESNKEGYYDSIHCTTKNKLLVSPSWNTPFWP
ncbi:MAG: hypothetical protein RJB66_665 [Pseudomonadota bacterium]|jgi:arginase